MVKNDYKARLKRIRNFKAKYPEVAKAISEMETIYERSESKTKKNG